MELPITGQHVSVTASEYMVELTTVDGFELQIEGDMEIRSSRGDRWPVALANGGGSQAELEPVLRGAITSAAVNTSGTLTIDLDSGNQLVVPPDDEYEAWTLVGPNGYRVVCMPHGELATWTAD
ncbi:DUF6188 family protein [Nocardia bovistercoris]|uniref:Uncharacterized protein n=1 Tax=Nocardia bovistercoris TaxID=2785916 RepID=A0A931IJM6_9NOCA|nr:DUF6188 family protein [Nocardia bovistercoris]MBH0781546.1 hypothetical protein [Nocardia bovistercoris]